ncbi:hypothetical protein E2C01_085706 [Portunus trituberculatus]|uniref:Uncharacterized protein n=1 Tax=Portunus trituberculatus TaxID=210409 RepID=A0A5B7J7G2_PORTR|nr:hypothetical protein [Portunus trituberculatus]
MSVYGEQVAGSLSSKESFTSTIYFNTTWVTLTKVVVCLITCRNHGRTCLLLPLLKAYDLDLRSFSCPKLQ